MPRMLAISRVILSQENYRCYLQKRGIKQIIDDTRNPGRYVVGIEDNGDP